MSIPITDEELLKRAVEYDGGPYPTGNGYIFDEDDVDSPTGSLTVSYRGPTGWAICHRRSCLSKDGEMLFESMPSHRDEAFIEQTRWATAREAFEFLNNWKTLLRSGGLAAGMIRWKDRATRPGS